MRSKRKLFTLVLSLILLVSSLFFSLPDDIEMTLPQKNETNTEEGAIVTKVIDGDTIEVLIDGKKERVRYIGIDTPELGSPYEAAECFGTEAKNKNQELVSDKEVDLVKDVSERDRYGRLLRYVYVGDVNIGHELVRLGYANALTYPPDISQSEANLSAQQEAQRSKRGLWNGCEEPFTPGSAGEEELSSPLCAIKGNISLSGEKIYHVTDCEYYEQTRINTEKGERWFCSEREAEKAGWRKANNCQI